MTFKLFDGDYTPPALALTIKLKPNPHKISDKQPALIGFVAVNKAQLVELGKLLEEAANGLVFLRVALWDDTDRGGEQTYPVNGVIEYKTYTPPTTDKVQPNANTGEWF